MSSKKLEENALRKPPLEIYTIETLGKTEESGQRPSWWGRGQGRQRWASAYFRLMKPMRRSRAGL